MRAMIQQAPLEVFAAMVFVPLVMAATAVFAGFAARRRAGLVEATAVVPIGMAQDGYRTIEGTAEAIKGEVVLAPLTRSECVWFSARVDEFRRRAASSTGRSEWVTVRELTSTAPIVVRDGTGACVVRVRDADITPRDKSRWTGGSLEPADTNPPRFGPLEPLNAMAQVSGGPGSRFRYTEMRIHAGDPLMVTGRFAGHRFETEPQDLDELPPDPSIAPDWAATDDDTPRGDGGDIEASAAAAPDAPALTWHDANRERTATLTALSAAITRAEMTAGGRGQPLMVAATSAATYASMTEMGAQAAFLVALVPLGIAAFVFFARYGS